VNALSSEQGHSRALSLSWIRSVLVSCASGSDAPESDPSPSGPLLRAAQAHTRTTNSGPLSTVLRVPLRV